MVQTQRLLIMTFLCQYYSPWAETVMVLHVNSPSPSKGRSTMNAPLRAGMMAIAGVPLLRIMTLIHPMAFAQRLVGLLVEPFTVPCARLQCSRWIPKVSLVVGLMWKHFNVQCLIFHSVSRSRVWSQGKERGRMWDRQSVEMTAEVSMCF